MKTKCLQTNETWHCLGKENALGIIGGKGSADTSLNAFLSKKMK